LLPIECWSKNATKATVVTMGVSAIRPDYAGIVAFLAAGGSFAASAAEKAGEAAKLPDFVPTWLGWLIVFVMFPVATWLSGKIYEQISQVITLRRTFVQETTKRVVALSDTHYWALANTAGTFGSMLQTYLRSVEAHLFVSYADEGSNPTESAINLQGRMREIANEAAAEAFPALVRLVHFLDRFQFRGSQTYLLPHVGSGEALRRLYNLLMIQLPDDGFVTEMRRAIERHLATEEKPQNGEMPAGIGGTFLEDHTKLDALGLAQLKVRFADWLAQRLPAVSEAARSTMAFAEIMSAELTRLNEPFFHDRAGFVGRLLKPTAPWHAGLSIVARRAVDRSQYESIFFRPLGGIGHQDSGAQQSSQDSAAQESSQESMGRDRAGARTDASRSNAGKVSEAKRKEKYLKENKAT
jgi:hypothetical protein